MICESCGKEHDGTYGSGRFCSSKCSHSRHVSESQRRKTSESVKRYYQTIKKPLRKDLAKQFNYTYVEDHPMINLPIHTCKVCGKRFYHLKHRVTCKNDNCIQSNRRAVQMNIPRKVRKSLSTIDCNFKYYFTYKVTNIINNKYYLGMHCTNNLDDGYIGSGVVINKAIRKYGKDNFKREILSFYNSCTELVDAEINLITEEVTRDPMSYNMTIGGTGGPIFKGRKHSEETRKKLSKRAKESSKSPGHLADIQKRRQRAKLRSYMFYQIYLLLGWESTKEITGIKHECTLKVYYKENWPT